MEKLVQQAFMAISKPKLLSTVMISLMMPLKLSWQQDRYVVLAFPRLFSSRSCIVISMEVIIIVLSGIRILLQVLTCIFFTLLWKYMNRKALGMQTLQDLMIKDYMLCVIGNFIVSNLSLMKFQDEYPHYLALALVHSTHFMVIAILSQIFSTIMVRYLSVFHQTILANVGDRHVIATTRTFLLLASFLTSFVDSFGVDGYQYQYLTGTTPKEDPGYNHRIIKFMIVTDLILLILVQVKIELFKRNVDQLNVAVDLIQEEENAFENKVTSRIAGVIAIAFLLFILNHFAFAKLSIIREFIARIGTQIIIVIVIPSFMVYKNQKFRDFCVKILLK